MIPWFRKGGRPSNSALVSSGYILRQLGSLSLLKGLNGSHDVKQLSSPPVYAACSKMSAELTDFVYGGLPRPRWWFSRISYSSASGGIQQHRAEESVLGPVVHCWLVST